MVTSRRSPAPSSDARHTEPLRMHGQGLRSAFHQSSTHINRHLTATLQNFAISQHPSVILFSSSRTCPQAQHFFYPHTRCRNKNPGYPSTSGALLNFCTRRVVLSAPRWPRRSSSCGTSQNRPASEDPRLASTVRNGSGMERVFALARTWTNVSSGHHQPLHTVCKVPVCTERRGLVSMASCAP